MKMFKNALRGLCHALVTERNMSIHLAIASCVQWYEPHGKPWTLFL